MQLDKYLGRTSTEKLALYFFSSLTSLSCPSQLPYRRSPHANTHKPLSRRLPDDQLRRQQVQSAGERRSPRCGVGCLRVSERVQHPLSRQAPHLFHRLTDSGEAGCIHSGMGNVIEADDGAVLGHASSHLAQRTYRSQSSEIVERDHGGELDSPFHHRRDETNPSLKAWGWIVSCCKLTDALRRKREPNFSGEALNSIPAAVTIGQF